MRHTKKSSGSPEFLACSKDELNIVYTGRDLTPVLLRRRHPVPPADPRARLTSQGWPPAACGLAAAGGPPAAARPAAPLDRRHPRATRREAKSTNRRSLPDKNPTDEPSAISEAALVDLY